MMQAVLAVFLVTLGLAQINSSLRGWRAASLVGPSRWAGYGAGVGLLVLGAWLLPATWQVLWWAFPAAVLAIGLLLLSGSFILPPPHPEQRLAAEQAAHSGCCLVHIPDGQYLMPGLLLTPPGAAGHEGLAVCVVPGAGDHKRFFKWRLIQALLAEELTVLVVDTPGHGDYRHRPMSWPDCLSAISSAVAFLRGQPGIRRIGLAGISLGGALSIQAVADSQLAQPPYSDLVDALVVLETPVALGYHRTLFYREVWAAFRAPVLSLLQEISVKQMVQCWKSGGYRSPHTTTGLVDMLNPLDNLSRLKNIPILLVYSERDPVAPPAAATAMQNAAPGADMLISKHASHVTLTLMPEVNRQMAHWLRGKLSRSVTGQGQAE